MICILGRARRASPLQVLVVWVTRIQLIGFPFERVAGDVLPDFRERNIVADYVLVVVSLPNFEVQATWQASYPAGDGRLETSDDMSQHWLASTRRL